LVRVQALLGPEAVLTAVPTGGRDPGERVRLVPWGDERVVEDTTVPARPGPVAPARDGATGAPGHAEQVTPEPPGRRPPADPPATWPGRLPAPSPATVPPDPVPVRLLAADGAEVCPAAPDLLDGVPRRVAGGGPDREVTGWAGPWPVHARWWAPDGPGPAVRLQVVLADGTALLLVHRGGRWEVAGVYD
ncbi:hypothetical protein ABT341_30055, partial [Pseudonocardia alni]